MTTVVVRNLLICLVFRVGDKHKVRELLVDYKEAAEFVRILISRLEIVDLVFSDEFPLYEGVLAAGATLLGYTDGVTEAFDLEHRAYGSERLLQVLRAGDNAQAACQRVLEDVRRHAGQAPQSDDITILAISRRRDD